MVRLFLTKEEFPPNTASARTIDNVRTIARELGFREVRTTGNILRQILNLLRFVFRKGIVLLVYPKFISPTHYKYLRLRLLVHRLLNVRKKVIYYVPDLPVEQAKSLTLPLKENVDSFEKRILDQADYLLVFDSAMQDTLTEKHGILESKFVYFEMLDYIIENPPKPTAKDTKNGVVIVFAGSLKRHAMEKSIAELPKGVDVAINYHFFGPNGDWTDGFRSDLIYHGSRTFFEIVSEVKNYHFGLILASLSEKMTRYMELTPTNRFSLYMASGVPVIVPRSYRYMARLVDRYNVGLIFDKMDELPDLIAKGIESYDDFIPGIEKLQKRVTTGYHLQTSLSKCLEEEKG